VPSPRRCRLARTGLILTRPRRRARRAVDLGGDRSPGIRHGGRPMPSRFHPDRLASRILGMGDIRTVERAQSTRPGRAAKPRRSCARAVSPRRHARPMQQMQKMGPLGQVMS
jgi:hypothetical protein